MHSHAGIIYPVLLVLLKKSTQFLPVTQFVKRMSDRVKAIDIIVIAMKY
jgi:hypothetical protein